MGRKTLLWYCRRVNKYSLLFWIVRLHLRLCDNQTWWMEMVVENRQRQQPVNWTRRYLRLVLKPATFQTYIVNLNVLLCSAAKPTHSRFRVCLIKTRKKQLKRTTRHVCALTVASRIQEMRYRTWTFCTTTSNMHYKIQ